MKRKIYQVDAFTDTPFGGNPAGVVPDADGLSEAQMQVLAREMNLSETAFVFPGGAGYDYALRFFTPTEEVDLCGHATIAAFHLLLELDCLPPGRETLKQKTGAGILDITLLSGGGILMRQAAPQRLQRFESSEDLAAVMGCAPTAIGIPGVLAGPEIWSTGLPDILLPMASLEALRQLTPVMEPLAEYSRSLGVTGVHAFALSAEGQLFCRNFAPACGIPEEAATGTSNGALGACLAFHGYNGGEGLALTVRQGDWMGRPSRIQVTVQPETQAVWVGGQAVTVLGGEILLP